MLAGAHTQAPGHPCEAQGTELAFRHFPYSPVHSRKPTDVGSYERGWSLGRRGVEGQSALWAGLVKWQVFHEDSETSG